MNSSVQGTSGLIQGGVPVDARIFLVPELLARDSDGVRHKDNEECIDDDENAAVEKLAYSVHHLRQEPHIVLFSVFHNLS